jgi:hypothetical protein
MSVVSVIGTIVFFAVVALALMAVMDVLFAPGRRSSGKVRSRSTARKSSSHAPWLGKVLMYPRVVMRAKKHSARRPESRPGGK